MKNQEIKFNNPNYKYSIIIGKGILGILSKKIKKLCPKVKKIAIIIDKKVPNKFKMILKKNLKNYNVTFLIFNSSEKSKSFYSVNYFLNKLLQINLNRNDLIISVGGGITGDVAGFVASIYKRGIDFINIPTTLLAQVDSAIGGKTGVNSKQGKNLIGSFYQPKLVLSDTNFINTLSNKEMICGYAEILKHAIIKDKNFFKWLQKNSPKIFLKHPKVLTYAIKKSCIIKVYFVTKDVNEKGLRMKLNFGHTFAHAIETKNNYSKNFTHGEAVLTGMILETRLSVFKNICNIKTLREIEEVYEKNKLSYTFKKFLNSKTLIKLLPYLKNDKKNNDEKINFILLKKFGNTTNSNANKISLESLRKYSKFITQY